VLIANFRSPVWAVVLTTFGLVLMTGLPISWLPSSGSSDPHP